MIEPPNSGTKCEFIAVRAEANNAARSNITEITVVAKFLSGKCIAQMNFDERNVDGEV